MPWLQAAESRRLFEHLLPFLSGSNADLTAGAQDLAPALSFPAGSLCRAVNGCLPDLSAAVFFLACFCRTPAIAEQKKPCRRQGAI
jgi:hypothetical protein